MTNLPEPTIERFVYLHGFTQTHHHWHRCAGLIHRDLGTATMPVYVDLPGHGLNASVRGGLVDGSSAIVDAAGSGTYVGYSMGGRFALHAAVARRNQVRRLVVVGATPGIANNDQRRERQLADIDLAAEVERIGVSAFIDQWLATPMFAGLPRDSVERAHRLRNSAAGLAAALREAGTGSQAPLWHQLGELPMPVLVIVGERDEKFAEIGRRMVDELSDGELATVPDAGHAAHLERPVETAHVIAEWIRSTTSPSTTSWRDAPDQALIASPIDSSTP